MIRAHQNQRLVGQSVGVEQDSPEDRDDDDGNDRRQEDQAAEQRPAPQLLVEEKREQQRQDHQRRDGPDDVAGGDANSLVEERVVRERRVVLEADEGLGPRRRAGFEEAEPDRPDHRPELEDDQEPQDREDEQQPPVRPPWTQPRLTETATQVAEGSGALD
jgi:hypothetical protein